MAVTAPTTRRRVGAAPADHVDPAGRAGERPGGALLLALLVALTYAAFAAGAAGYPAEARLQVGLAAVALVACGLLVLHGGLRLRASPAGWAALGLLAAFAAWSGLTLAWTVAPSGTWTELNRAIAYTLVLGLALAAGSWYPRAVWRGALAYAGIALLVALYALGGKVAPGVHLDGLIDLNQTRDFSRLRAPLEYWNALALFLSMAVPVVLRLVVDETRPVRVRLGALIALPVYLMAIGLTYSRGGVLALVVAVGVTIAIAGARLRSLMYLALALAAAAPALAIGFGSDDLTTNFVPLADRRGDGLLLGGLLALSLLALAVVGRLVLAAEARTSPNARRSRLIGRALLGALIAAALVGVGAMATSQRGLTGTVSHEWDTFRSPREAAAEFDPNRLLSTNSSNRWVWWSEAAGAFGDRPLEGWGAGSFPVEHRVYRTNHLSVLQPHSVPLQFLSETGLLGGLLALGAIALLLIGAAGALRRLVPGPERGVAAALFGASVAWALHGFYDWDWDIPGVTLPALVFLGLLCALGHRDIPRPGLSPRLGTGGRAAVMGAAALALGTVALSAALPSWADSDTRHALASVQGNASPRELEQAQSQADFASRLDPLSVQPLLAAASIADRRGRTLQARDYVLRAIGRQPDSLVAWQAVVRTELRRGDLLNARRAVARLLDLDPRSVVAPVLVATIENLEAPVADSATATGTPLVAVVGQTPLQPKAEAAVSSAIANAAAAADPSFFPPTGG